MKKRILSLLALFCGFLASTSAIYGGNEKPKQSNDNYLTFTNNSANDIQISLQQQGTPHTISLVFSTDDGANWNDLGIDELYTIAASKSFKIAAGSEGTPGKTINTGFSRNSTNDYYYLNISDSSGVPILDPAVSVSGDVTSLLNGVGGDVDLSSNNNYQGCFARLFGGPSHKAQYSACSCITSAPNLPSTKLAKGCYASMFYACRNLVSAPSLPATTLAESCYNTMFAYCTSLVSAPNLSAETLYKFCYNWMFLGCTSLVSAPDLPATELMESCYTSMFSNCKALVKISDLSHVTSIGTNSLDLMFNNCTKLSIKSVTTETGNWAIGITGTTTGTATNMFAGCTGVSCYPTPTIGTKYYLGIPGVSFEPVTSLGGYYTKGGNKQAMCAFGVTAISDNLSSITEFGFAVYNGSSYEDTIKTTDASKIKELSDNKGGRFYTIIDCNGAGVTKKVKAYAKIGDNRYDSSVISATSDLDNEYSI